MNIKQKQHYSASNQAAYKTRLLVLVGFFAFIVGTGVSLVTTNQLVMADCGKTSTSIIDCTNVNDTSATDSGVGFLLKTTIKIMAGGVGILAVGAIVYASILYASAGGAQDQVKKAIIIIRDSVIGLILFIFMFAILNFLIPGGVLN